MMGKGHLGYLKIHCNFYILEMISKYKLKKVKKKTSKQVEKLISEICWDNSKSTWNL